MTSTDKHENYKTLLAQMEAVLKDEDNVISILSTISCMISQQFQSFFWVGFYIEDRGVLRVGPYQGTLGCLHIDFDRGVCGRAFRTGETQIVDDVHSDPEHIACDARTNSEIVVPVFGKDGSKYGVLDIDSTASATFDSVDRHYLEVLVQKFIQPFI